MTRPFSLLALSLFLLVVAHLQGLQGPNGESYFPVEISNESQIAGDEEVYVLIKGINPKTKSECFMVFDDEGWGVCVDVTEETKSEDYSIPVDELPWSNGVHTVQVPKIESGRLYISLHYPMDMEIQGDSNTGFKIVDPDGFKPRDSNYYTLYDKVELTYVDAGTWMNPTAVDFFSLPIRISQSGSVSKVTEAGLSGSRAAILEKLVQVIKDYDKTETEEWAKLFLSYESRDGTSATFLRFMAPGKAMIEGLDGTDPFDPMYLLDEKKYGFNWTNFVWDYYRENVLLIDCTELGGSLTEPGTPGYVAPLFAIGSNTKGDYIFVGQVEGDEFVFRNETGTYEERIQKPTSSTPWFAGATYPFDASNNTPKAVVVREITSAFEVGLIPAEDKALFNNTYFEDNKEKYYEDNNLPAYHGYLPPTDQGPWYDLYSQALHSFGEANPIYTFAYDDALGQDGTLHDNQADNLSTARITLDNMTGTVIPDPYEDNSLYDVTVIIGDQSVVYYEGKELKYGDKLSQVSVPFVVDLNGEEAKIYFDPQMVRPHFSAADGIVIKELGDKEIEITFPGLPSND